MAPKFAAFNQGGVPVIDFINKATVPLGVDLDAMIAALQKQVTNDFAPIWGDPAVLRRADMPSPGSWSVVLADDADQVGALGYHDLLQGWPIGYVFVKTTLNAGEKLSVTVSHELLEMLEDADVSGWKLNSVTRQLWAWEMCDAVEEETYQIDGIDVSDFVMPAFFEPWHPPGSVKFDFLGKCPGPYHLMHGGYTLLLKSGRMTQKFAATMDHPSNPHLMIAFGSAEKEKKFVKEDRRLHRSEFRHVGLS